MYKGKGIHKKKKKKKERKTTIKKRKKETKIERKKDINGNTEKIEMK